MRWIQATFLISALVAAAVALAGGTYVGKVVSIADGDTLTILVVEKTIKVRLAEIDTPDRGQPYGQRAKKYLGQLTFGKEARVVEVDQDRYGRLVGRVYVEGLDINAEMVRQGHAWVYRKYASDPLGSIVWNGKLGSSGAVSGPVTAIFLPGNGGRVNAQLSATRAR